MEPRHVPARSHAGHALFSAVVMLLYGFYIAPEGISDSALYNASVDLLRWTMQAGGIGFGLIAVAHGMGRRGAGAANVLVSSLCGLVFLATGAYWLIVDGGLQPVVLLLFGGVLLHGARLSWKAGWHRRLGGENTGETPVPQILPRSDAPGSWEQVPSGPPRAPEVVNGNKTAALRPVDESVEDLAGDAATDDAGGYLEALGREARRAGGEDGRLKG